MRGIFDMDSRACYPCCAEDTIPYKRTDDSNVQDCVASRRGGCLDYIRKRNIEQQNKYENAIKQGIPSVIDDSGVYMHEILRREERNKRLSCWYKGTATMLL